MHVNTHALRTNHNTHTHSLSYSLSSPLFVSLLDPSYSLLTSLIVYHSFFINLLTPLNNPHTHERHLEYVPLLLEDGEEEGEGGGFKGIGKISHANAEENTPLVTPWGKKNKQFGEKKGGR